MTHAPVLWQGAKASSIFNGKKERKVLTNEVNKENKAGVQVATSEALF